MIISVLKIDFKLSHKSYISWEIHDKVLALVCPLKAPYTWFILF